MPSFKELRFTIEGKIDGVDFTPTTIPMSRLAEYLLDLATLLGHKESVHLIGVKDGSAQPVILYDETEEGRSTLQKGSVKRIHPRCTAKYERNCIPWRKEGSP